ncbi:MAG TPA: hypothetical protein VJI33_03475 [Candidatus Paceibacterota bacterium]
MQLIETAEVEAIAAVHSHIREGEVVGPLIEQEIEGGADVIGPMPNTDKGLTTAKDVVRYIDEAKSLVPAGKVLHFVPIVMITELTTREELIECFSYGIRNAKVYPYMRTTKSHNGVRNYGGIIKIIQWCGELGIKVHFHPEHPWMTFTNRDAEFAFLPLALMFLQETKATIIWEHGTDARCIPFWEELAKETGRFFVTITAHHLATNEDETFGDVRATCKPPIKTEGDRKGLVELVAKDYSWVMAGPDTAPHKEGAKHPEEGKCACGAHTGPFLHPLYAHSLDSLLQTQNGVQTYVNFTSRNARKLHGLPPASRSIRLVRKPMVIPRFYQTGPWKVQSFWSGQALKWSFDA